MAGRIRSMLGVFCRGWLFGAVLGLVLGGVFGSWLVPVVGTVSGGFIGVVLGAIVGPVAAVAIALAALRPASVLTDRVWPAAVCAVLAYVLCTEVVFSGMGGWSEWALLDAVVLAAVVAAAGGLAAWFGAAMIRGVRVRLLRTPWVVVVAGTVGAIAAAWRVLEQEGWSEPGLLLGLTVGGFVAGGILGGALVAFNLLVTKEPAAE